MEEGYQLKKNYKSKFALDVGIVGEGGLSICLLLFSLFAFACIFQIPKMVILTFNFKNNIVEEKSVNEFSLLIISIPGTCRSIC